MTAFAHARPGRRRWWAGGMSTPLSWACVYQAAVVHRRLGAGAYRFRYRVFSLLLDIDRLDQIAADTWLFSRNRFNLLEFLRSRSPAARGAAACVAGPRQIAGRAGHRRS